MTNKNSLVAFIDILGFRNHIDNYYSGKDTKFLQVLKTAMKDAETFAIDYSKNYLKQFKIKFTFRQFSDCICITMPLKQKLSHTNLTLLGSFVNVVRTYQLILLVNEIYVRGGVSIGGHFENSNMIFSEGIVKAYKLESQKAIYPRIILDEELLKLLQQISKENSEDFETFSKIYGQSLIKDWDEEVFISPFGMIQELKETLNQLDEENRKHFLESYLNVNSINSSSADEIIEDLNKSDYELQFIQETTNKVNQFLLDKVNEKPEVILKYKWMKQFLVWNLNPENSQIKFEHYFKSDPTRA